MEYHFIDHPSIAAAAARLLPINGNAKNDNHGKHVEREEYHQKGRGREKIDSRKPSGEKQKHKQVSSIRDRCPVPKISG